MKQGKLFSYSGKQNEALECYNKILKLDSDNHIAWFEKGNIYVNKLDYNEALKCYDKAIELYPQYADAYFNRGNVKFILSNNREMGCPDWLKAEEYGKINMYEYVKFCR